MRAAFWLLALFALAVALTLVAQVDQGYVIVVYPPWRMELSFMLALALLAGLIVLAYAVLRLGQTALRLPDDVRGWHARRRGGLADRALMDAMRAHLDGDAFRAAKLAGKAMISQAPDIAERLVQQGAGTVPPAGRIKSWFRRLRSKPANPDATGDTAPALGPQDTP